MVPHLASALDMALASLQDPAPQLRRAATVAVIALAPWAVDATSVKAFQARMPQILQVRTQGASLGRTPNAQMPPSLISQGPWTMVLGQ